MIKRILLGTLLFSVLLPSTAWACIPPIICVGPPDQEICIPPELWPLPPHP